MVKPSTIRRAFKPGTSGWCAADLDDPAIARQWDENRFEMIEGVLVEMPPAYFDHGSVTYRLLRLVDDHLRERGFNGDVSFDVDLIADDDTVFRVDGMVLLPEDIEHQRAVLRERERATGQIGRVRIAPTLALEVASRGHERHDYEVKRRRYAAFGIPNYWIADLADRSLLCLKLEGDQYVEDARGHGEQQIQPTAFAGLMIPLKDVFH